MAETAVHGANSSLSDKTYSGIGMAQEFKISKRDFFTYYRNLWSFLT